MGVKIRRSGTEKLSIGVFIMDAAVINLILHFIPAHTILPFIFRLTMLLDVPLKK